MLLLTPKTIRLILFVCVKLRGEQGVRCGASGHAIGAALLRWIKSIGTLPFYSVTLYTRLCAAMLITDIIGCAASVTA
jgi:hypothetical protein